MSYLCKIVGWWPISHPVTGKRMRFFFFISLPSQQMYLGPSSEAAVDTDTLRDVVSCTPLVINHGLRCATSNCFFGSAGEGDKCLSNNSNSVSHNLCRGHWEVRMMYSAPIPPSYSPFPSFHSGHRTRTMAETRGTLTV